MPHRRGNTIEFQKRLHFRSWWSLIWIARVISIKWWTIKSSKYHRINAIRNTQPPGLRSWVHPVVFDERYSGEFWPWTSWGWWELRRPNAPDLSQAHANATFGTKIKIQQILEGCSPLFLTIGWWKLGLRGIWRRLKLWINEWTPQSPTKQKSTLFQIKLQWPYQ